MMSKSSLLMPVSSDSCTIASIAAGDFKLTYTRLESYNLNITEIWLMYK